MKAGESSKKCRGEEGAGAQRGRRAGEGLGPRIPLHVGGMACWVLGGVLLEEHGGIQDGDQLGVCSECP